MLLNTYLLPVWPTIQLAWQKVYGAKGSIWAGFGLTLLIIFGMGVFSGIMSAMFKLPALGIAANIILQVLNLLLTYGLLYIGIRRALDLPFSYRNVFHTFEGPIALRIIGLYILQVIIFLPAILILVFGPLALMMLAKIMVSFSPSVLKIVMAAIFLFAFCALIYLIIRIIFAAAFVLDKGLNPWEAIKLSFAATRHNFWRIVGILFLQIIIQLISMLPIFIGLIWTVPFGFILYGEMYKFLSLNSNPQVVTETKPI